jgi:acyl carrier protein
MTLEEISKEIIIFIEQLSGVDSDKNIATNESLLSEQVVDSLGIIELVSHIEGKYNLQMEQDDLIVENFDSVRAISNYIVSKI